MIHTLDSSVRTVRLYANVCSQRIFWFNYATDGWFFSVYLVKKDVGFKSLTAQELIASE